LPWPRDPLLDDSAAEITVDDSFFSAVHGFLEGGVLDFSLAARNARTTWS
jgi:hypothetical protein